MRAISSSCANAARQSHLLHAIRRRLNANFTPVESGVGHTVRNLDAKIRHRHSAAISRPPWAASPGRPRVEPRGRGGPRLAGLLLSRRASRPLQPIRKDLVIRFRRQRLAREAIMAAKEISVKKYVVRLSGEERERLETL